MPLPAFRNSRSKVRRRRSHLALSAINLAVCPKCEAPILPHHACEKCGNYRNRTMKGKTKNVEKVLEKKTKAKAPKAKKAKAEEPKA
ncbi:MAG: 50S ribosomal protein L32 [Patescibacteria group bacterium]|jgi:large subunit ribosomal protein L32